MSKLSKTLKIAAFCLALSFFLFVPLFVIPRITTEHTQAKQEKKGIIELWHIESFEGGSASRVDWLLGRSREFENKHKGVYVSVTLKTKEQVFEAIENGQHFDLLSFSTGLGAEIMAHLQEYKGAVNSSDNFTAGGVWNGRQYAVPYMTGGYFLFTTDERAENLREIVFEPPKKQNILVCGYGLTNSPLTALALNSVGKITSDSKLDIDEKTTQFKAYERFLRGESRLLLGTQRDQFRLWNRMANGRLDYVKAEALGGFTDLVQYVALSGSCDKMLEYATLFIEFLTFDGTQAKLSRCNMLSVCGVGVYSGGEMKMLEDALKKAKTVNVFSSAKSLEGLRAQSLRSLANADKNDILFFLTSGGVLT